MMYLGIHVDTKQRGVVTDLTENEDGTVTFHLTNGRIKTFDIQLHKQELPDWFENGAMVTVDAEAMAIYLHPIEKTQ